MNLVETDTLTARQSEIWMDLFMLIIFYLSGAIIPTEALNGLMDEAKKRLGERGFTPEEIEAEYEVMRHMLILRDGGAMFDGVSMDGVMGNA